jgi:hypothetical protein
MKDPMEKRDLSGMEESQWQLEQFRNSVKAALARP